MRVHLIHGIHEHGDGGNTAKLKPFFEKAGFKVVVHDYGYARALFTRIANPWRVRKIAKHVKPDDILVGHSNGCTISWMLQRKRQVRGCVFINPALDEDVAFAGTAWVDVYFNRNDEIVALSESWGFWDLIKHPWGEMGKIGYVGPDRRVTNIDCQKTRGMPRLHGHSDFFSKRKLPKWAGYLVRRVAEKV